MKKLFLTLFLVGFFVSVFSQKAYFVYIQSEGGQPFYVTLDQKIRSSSSSGYLILSNLVDSTYSFSIGFPKNEKTEQQYTISLNAKDHGFLLKQFPGKGWGLFDLQTLEVHMSSVKNVSGTEATKDNNASPFTEMLSKVADDPSILENSNKQKSKPVAVEEKAIVKKVKAEESPVEPQKEEPVIVEKPLANPPVEKPVVKQESVNKNADNVEEKVGIAAKEKKEEAETPTAIIAASNRPSPYESYSPSIVKKWSESSTSQGFGLVFIDNYENGDIDTIKLFIPNPPRIEVPVTTEKKEKEQKQFLDITSANPVVKENAKEELITPVVKDTLKAKPVLSNYCSVVALESDFLLLRKQMAAQTTDDKMIDAAKDYFKKMCFTAEQIKNLCVLFLNDEARYRFLDLAYTNVADAQNYPPLQDLLKDPYYMKRFKAMLRN
ncbi:MAG: DUF4476 domain-containing protein [Chitinophagaceae bacterium]|nr:DUF4476 domain-containing protein [Chitinophagaceae bacterium]